MTLIDSVAAVADSKLFAVDVAVVLSVLVWVLHRVQALAQQQADKRGKLSGKG